MSEKMIDEKPQSDAQRYYDVLKTIARGYKRSEKILRSGGEPEWGIDATETLEYAYDNIQHLAECAIKNKRRPKQ